ncbi:DnaB-like helicase N-terminal domain-containing protein [Actinomadura hibisca]|uniref:DnaB-like helicase N-terminal domain-containing protein n=1 Tax=Actinomadura hibisca TaxID=68565 RepID=UPI000835B806|nr:DnaB-like helicase N-terminal domain-containing protein [Actinomadura hibisca]
MTSLVHRTEEALLGALIHNPALVADAPYLRPSHFDDPDHQAIFAELVDLRVNEPALRGIALAEQIVFLANQPDITLDRLTGLALNSPDIASIAHYGRMIQEAGLYREFAVHAERITREAGEVRGVDPQLDHLDELAHALAGHYIRFNAAFNAPLTVADVDQTTEDPRAVREELLLADLIQHPAYIAEVSPWLDAGVFTADERRDLYHAIVTVELNGEPIEELTLAWEMTRSQQSELPIAATITDSGGSPASAGQINRLASLAVEAGASVEIGADLLADHTRDELTAGKVTLSVVTDHTRASTLRQETQQRSLGREVPQAQAPLLEPPAQQIGLDGREMRQK